MSPRRFDRPPVLTAAVAAVTAVVSVAGLLSPALTAALERNGPLISAGQLWRPLTSLLVQDGGVAGTVTNLLGLVVAGTLAEMLCGRGRWAVAYLGAGLVGEVAGWSGWQPLGAGNSVAVCGLAALLAVTLARSSRVPSGTPAFAAMAAGGWSAALVGGALGSSVLIIGLWLAVAVATGVAVRLAEAGRLPFRPGLVPVAIVVLGAVLLLVRTDIHGAALAGGLLIAVVITRGTPARPRSDGKQRRGRVQTPVE